MREGWARPYQKNSSSTHSTSHRVNAISRVVEPLWLVHGSRRLFAGPARETKVPRLHPSASFTILPLPAHGWHHQCPISPWHPPRTTAQILRTRIRPSRQPKTRGNAPIQRTSSAPTRLVSTAASGRRNASSARTQMEWNLSHHVNDVVVR